MEQHITNVDGKIAKGRQGSFREGGERMKRWEVVEYIRSELDRRSRSITTWDDCSYYRNEGAQEALEEILEMLTRD